jgi:hypothetical protein
MEFMGRAMVFGEGEAGADYYDTNTHAAMQALRAKGVKPGQAKQINKDVAREMGKVMADRYAEDPLGTLALIGEKMKSALEKGFTLKDLGASQDFLAAITKTFMGGGSGDMQEMSRRIGEEGTVSGMEEKYGEAVRGEVGAAWEMLKASISNMADAFSKTSPLYTSIDGLARFMNDIAGRWSRETTLSLGGTINPETGMPFKNKEEGKAFGIQSEAITGAESWRSTLKWLGIDISQDSFKGLIDLHKDYYDSGLHETFVPKIHGMMGLYARGKANAAYDAASSWWRGYRRRKSEASLKTPEELEAMRISGDPGYEVALRRDKTARENLDIYSVEEEAIAKRQDPFLTRNARFSNADVDALKRGGSNKELSESARNWWSNNWKKVMGVKSVSELMNPRMWGVDKFDQENAPPVIRYGWGYDPYWEGHGVKQGFGLDSAVPEMSEAMSRQGKLDISGVGSSLAELVAAIKKAAGDINKATENIQPKTPGGGNPKVNSSIPPG